MNIFSGLISIYIEIIATMMLLQFIFLSMIFIKMGFWNLIKTLLIILILWFAFEYILISYMETGLKINLEKNAILVLLTEVLLGSILTIFGLIITLRINQVRRDKKQIEIDTKKDNENKKNISADSEIKKDLV